MMSRMDALTQALAPESRGRTGASGPSGRPVAGEDFRSVLNERMAQSPSRVRFSKHATQRLEQRRLHLSEADLRSLERATDKAAAKGSREALMMMGGLHLIVSVRDRTVVTAMPAERAGDVVYTNIDSAILVGQNTETVA